MTDRTPKPTTPLLIMEDAADGYCDPVTGVCSLPDTSSTNAENAARETPVEAPHSSKDTDSSAPDEPTDQD